MTDPQRRDGAHSPLAGLGYAIKNAAAPLVNIPREAWKRVLNILRGIKDVSVVEAHALVFTKGALLLDVREQTEWDVGHVPGSLFIPLGQLTARIDELAPHKGRPIAIICHGGVRSARAVSQLAGLGFVDLYNVAGGILAWRKAGLPETKPSS